MQLNQKIAFVSLKRECLNLFTKLIKINKIYSRHCTRDIKDKLLKNALILSTLKKALQGIKFGEDSALLKNSFSEALDRYLVFVEYNFINNTAANPRLVIMNNNSFKILESLDLKDCYDVSSLSVKKVFCTKVREALRDRVQELQKLNNKLFDNLEFYNNKNKIKESFTKSYLVSFSKKKYFGFLGLFTNHKVHLCILKRMLEKDLTTVLVSKDFDHEGLYLKLSDNDFMTHLMIVELHGGDVLKNIEIFFEEYEDLESSLLEFILWINHLFSINPNIGVVNRKAIKDFVKFSEPLKENIKKIRELTEELKKDHIVYLKAMELLA